MRETLDLDLPDLDSEFIQDVACVLASNIRLTTRFDIVPRDRSLRRAVRMLESQFLTHEFTPCTVLPRDGPAGGLSRHFETCVAIASAPTLRAVRVFIRPVALPLSPGESLTNQAAQAR